MPGAFFQSGANAVSADGSTVVGLGDGDDGFRWTEATGMVAAGMASEFSYGNAHDVSADGSVVVGVYFDVFGPVRGYRWTYGGAVQFFNGFPDGTNSNIAYATSDDASVMVGSAAKGGSNHEAYRWTSATGMVGLGRPAGGESLASGISANGTTIVGHQIAAGGGLSQGFFWTPASGRVLLGDLAGGSVQSSPQAVSADGLVVVGYSSSTLGSEAFRWVNGVMTGMGDLPGGVVGSNALDISDDGSIIVGTGTTALGSEAFFWNGGSMFNLREVLAAKLGVPLENWRLTAAAGVSADGRTVAGSAINPVGQLEAWRAQLIDMNWKNPASGSWDSLTNWDLPILPAAMDAVEISPVGALTVAGPTLNASVRTLTLGGGAGHATLRLAGAVGGDLHAVESISILANGELALADGRAALAPTISNNGVIRGSGKIGSTVDNSPTGRIVASAGDRLFVTGSLNNMGQVDVLAGEFETAGPSNSTVDGFVFARDATLRFTGGLTNEGVLTVSGEASDVFGDITNAGTMLVTGGAVATFYDDVTNDGTLRVSSAGSAASAAVFLGAYSGAGATTGGGDIFFEGDLRPGNSPAAVTFNNNVAFGESATLTIELLGTAAGVEYDQVTVHGALMMDGTLAVTLPGAFTPSAGDSFDILDWTTANGAFDAISLPALAGLAWDTSELYTLGLLSVAPGLSADFNLDGVVDGADLGDWQQGFGPVAEHAAGDADADGDADGADFLAWQRQVGAPPSVVGTAAVPEPGAALLLLTGGAGMAAMTLNRRRR